MEIFKNGVGRPSNETLRKRRVIILVIVIAVFALVGGGLFYLSQSFKVSGKNKNASTTRPDVIPIYTAGSKTGTKITPNKNSVTINVSSNINPKYQSGQGMTRVQVDGVWYVLSAVIESGITEDKRDKSNTYIYIITNKIEIRCA